MKNPTCRDIFNTYEDIVDATQDFEPIFFETVSYNKQIFEYMSSMYSLEVEKYSYYYYNVTVYIIV